MAVPGTPLVTTIPVGYTPHNQLHIDENTAINYLAAGGAGTAGLFLATPSGAPGVADFRPIVAADLSALTIPTTIGACPSNSIPIGATRYGGLFGAAFQAAELNSRARLPVGGVLKNFSINTVTAQPGAGSLVITLMLNGVATAITVTVAAGAAAAQFSDLVNTVTVVAGDFITMRFVNNDAVTLSAIVINWTMELDVKLI